MEFVIVSPINTIKGSIHFLLGNLVNEIMYNLMIFTGVTLPCKGSDCVHYHGVYESTEMVDIPLLGSLQKEYL